MSTPPSRAQQLRLWEHQVFLILTIVVGVVAGLAAVLFTVAIEQTSHRLFGLAPTRLRLFAVPPLMSLVTGLMLARFLPDVRGSGVPQTEAAYHLNSGIIPGRVPFGKFLTGVLCIGSGHSIGREGPSVQIGAGLASLVGQWLHLSPRRVRDLVPVGAAGALAAAFNTPVAAVIVERSILGNEPLFHVPAYHLVHPAELIAYAALGILGGLVSLLFCKGLLGLRHLFLGLPRWTKIIQPAMGGLVIGVVLIYRPAVMGVGYEYVDQALNGGLLLKTMAILCFLKLGATIVSYASGNAGGIFAPSLYIGAMAGGAVGMLVHQIAPFPTGDPGVYALVGMGTLFAGIVRAPMTSVFMIFEITQDYQILVPLMVANMLSFAISKRYQPLPVYHALLQQDGVHLPSPATQALTPARTARQVMQTDLSLISPDASVEQAWQMAVEQGAPAYLVGTRNQLVGSLSHQRLEASMRSGGGADLVESIVDRSFAHAHVDHPIDVVIERFGQSGGILPVVSRADAHRVEGVVTIDSILKLAERQARKPESPPSAAAVGPADRGVKSII